MPIEVEHVMTGCVSEAEARAIAFKLVESYWSGRSGRKITRSQDAPEVRDWRQPGTVTLAGPLRAMSAMKCDANNGYVGWKVIDKGSGQTIEHVSWIDPDENTYCTIDVPRYLHGNELACTVHRAGDIKVEWGTATFWVTQLGGTVAPLSPGRQHTPEPTDRPCADCCQPQACRRTNYCAAHRCDFGSVAP